MAVLALAVLACGGDRKAGTAAGTTAAATAAPTDPRAAIFVSKGCPQCHSISALGVKSPAEVGPDSPYGVFLASLRPKGKGAALLQESNLGEPVLVFTGAKPPPPGTVQAWPKSKPEKRKAAAKAPGGKDAAAGKPAAAKASMTPAPAGETAPKPRPRKPAAKAAPASVPVSQASQAR